MIERLIMNGSARLQIEEAARAAFPRECCGLLEGVIVDNVMHVTAIHPTRNLAADLDRFEIDPSDQIRILKSLRGTERDVVGCYHSHPNGRAELSDRDREGGFGEGFVWMVVALGWNPFRKAAALSVRPPLPTGHRPTPPGLRTGSPIHGRGNVVTIIRCFEFVGTGVEEVDVSAAA